MNITSLLALLQAAAALLISAQSPQATPAAMQNAINAGNHAVQIAVQDTAKINFLVPQNTGIWANIDELSHAPYLDGKGNYVSLGSTVMLVQEDTSFGDINNDGMDDAAVVVNVPDAAKTPHYFLAAMLNQNNILFNIADLPLGNSINIKSHQVANGMIVIDGKQYQLLGRELQAL